VRKRSGSTHNIQEIVCALVGVTEVCNHTTMAERLWYKWILLKVCLEG